VAQRSKLLPRPLLGFAGVEERGGEKHEDGEQRAAFFIELWYFCG